MSINGKNLRKIGNTLTNAIDVASSGAEIYNLVKSGSPPQQISPEASPDRMVVDEKNMVAMDAEQPSWAPWATADEKVLQTRLKHLEDIFKISSSLQGRKIKEIARFSIDQEKVNALVSEKMDDLEGDQEKVNALVSEKMEDLEEDLLAVLVYGFSTTGGGCMLFFIIISLLVSRI